jgi:DNA-binding response OmpR family regulator
LRVLLIEDSKPLQRSLSTALRKADYAVDVTGDGAEGLWFAESNVYDVIILDWMLPGMDGLEILRRLRRLGQSTQVLILTARDTIEDRVRGLQTGADDYLIKPFALEELLARVQALCRRYYQQKDPHLHVADLEIDTAARTAKRAGHRIELSPREYRLLEYLARRTGEVVSRTDIWQHIYDERTELMSNTVESAICNLRKKISPPGTAALLRTRRGMGYVLGGPRS